VPETAPESVSLEGDENEPGCPELEEQGDDESEAEDEEDKDGQDEVELLTSVRCSARIHGGIVQPSRNTLTTVKLKEDKHNSASRNEEVKEAKVNEIKLVFEELEATIR
jgi:hypothetical protein